jgi:hypothetical protein
VVVIVVVMVVLILVVIDINIVLTYVLRNTMIPTGVTDISKDIDG